MLSSAPPPDSTAGEPPTVGWDDPKTARYYAAFSRRHSRYRRANRVLTARAALAPGQRIIDIAAGTGGTSEAALPFLGRDGSILCVEPSAAMRLVGKDRLRDPRVTWAEDCPDEPAGFDRILCGAAVWLLLPLPETFRRLHALLRIGGALCLNIPSLYLGEADEPGGGRDPQLLELPFLLAKNRTSLAPQGEILPGAAEVEALLTAAGFQPECWTFRLRFSQKAYRDWLKIPVITNGLLAGLNPDERARRIDDAFRFVDPESWRWERWTGWTAWKLRS